MYCVGAAALLRRSLLSRLPSTSTRMSSSAGKERSKDRQDPAAEPEHADTVWSRVRDFVFASEKENFDPSNVRRAHAKDGLDSEQWTLVYRDLGASRSFFMVSSLLPLFAAGVAVISFDICNNDKKKRMEFVQRIVRDFEELGVLVYVPLAAAVAVLALIIRVQQCRLLRIYQNRRRPDEYAAIRSKAIVAQNTMHFSRDQTSAFYFAEEQTDTVRVALQFLFGTMQIGSRRFLAMDECFRGNNYRSYMLNETSIPPRL